MEMPASNTEQPEETIISQEQLLNVVQRLMRKTGDPLIWAHYTSLDEKSIVEAICAAKGQRKSIINGFVIYQFFICLSLFSSVFR